MSGQFEPILDAWYLTGPTASGKTSVGVELALRLDAEILSLDSMAIYVGMDIGTAKPTVDERRGVPHHMIDIATPDQEFSVAQYVETAHRIVCEIRDRGKTPLFVGGTPLYLKSLLRGIFESPPADEALRDRLKQEAADGPPGFLHERLQAIDPKAADRLHPNDTRRIIRAIEVHTITGRPISEFQQQFNTPRRATEDLRVFALGWPRPTLHDRINQRVDIMFDQGLVQEVEALRSAYPRLSKTALQATGYHETLAYLKGEITLDECRDLVKVHTRQLAKRQETWFRSLAECRVIQMHAHLSATEVAEQILRTTEEK